MSEAAQAKTDEARKAALRQAYTAATTRLRNENQNAFNVLYADEAAKRGVDWKPKPTAEEKAQEEIATLLRINPGLIDYITAEVEKVKGEQK